MIRRAMRARSGITLTEILMSILIMGVGMISLATLFPLGLIRLRNAQRLVRGALLMEMAQADLGSRNLLAKSSFNANPFVSPWYQAKPQIGQFYTYYDPWTVDTPSYGGIVGTTGVSATLGPGLPVAYDPLWRAVTGVYPDNIGGTVSVGNINGQPNIAEARFGSGIGFIRPDPDGISPSCYGPQRVTNFQANVSVTLPQPPATAGSFAKTIEMSGIPTVMGISITNAQIAAYNTAVLQTFISPEDLVLQDKTPGSAYLDPFLPAPSNTNPISDPSTVVPDMTSGTPVVDWRYTWFFTGRQSDASNATVFEGDVVICENRPFAYEQVQSPFGGNVYQAAGETVVEAVWGYSTTPNPKSIIYQNQGNTIGYGAQSAIRSVIIRWPSTVADPDVRVGSWICDNTYERGLAANNSRFGNGIGISGYPSPYASLYPGQRCYWYQITKRTDADTDPGFHSDPALPAGVPYRRMVLNLSTPVRAQTQINFAKTPAEPYHVESALIMPSVVNVYPRTVYTR